MRPISSLYDRIKQNVKRIMRFSTKTNVQSKPIDILGVIVFGGISLGTAGLGVWQFNRYFEKLSQIESSTSLFNQPIIELPKTFSNIDADEWKRKNFKRRIVLEGKFDHTREVLLGLRTGPNSLGSKAQGLASNPQGFYVITPFILKDGTTVLVNRGWISRTIKTYSRPTDVLKLDAVVTQEEKKALFSPANDSSSKRLLWLERQALIEAASLDPNSPFLLFDSVQDDDSKVFPRGKSGSDYTDHYVTPITHAVYSLTWFSLSISGFAMTYFLFKRKPAAPRKVNLTIKQL